MNATRKSRWVGAVGIVVLAIVLGVVVAVQPRLALAAAVVVPLVIVTAARPGTVAAVLLLWGTVKYSMLKLLPALGGVFAQAEVVCLVLVAGFTLMRLARRSGTSRLRLRSFWWLIAFVAAGLASWAANSGTLTQLLAGTRSLLTMPLLALAVAVAGEESDYRLLLVWGVALTCVQVPIAAVQFAVAGLKTDVDLVNGTLGLGGSNLLGIWMLAASAGAYYAFLRRGGIGWLAAALAFFSVVVMCGSRISILAAPVFLIALGLYAGIRFASPGATARLVGSAVILVVVSVALVTSVYTEYARAGINIGTAAADLSPTSLLQRQTQIGDYSVPRLAYLAYGLGYLDTNSRFVPLGTGPASAGSGAAAAATTDYESSPFAVGLRLESEGLATYASQSRVVTRTSQFVSTVVEYGPVGLFLMLMFYVAYGVRAGKCLYRSGETSLSETILVGVLPVVFVFATIGTLYGVTWEGLNIVGLMFWWVVLLSGAMGRQHLTSAGIAEA